MALFLLLLGIKIVDNLLVHQLDMSKLTLRPSKTTRFLIFLPNSSFPIPPTKVVALGFRNNHYVDDYKLDQYKYLFIIFTLV